MPHPQGFTPIGYEKKHIKRNPKHPLSIERTQFPLVVVEAMIIHKSQGSTYTNLILDLRGQLTPKRNELYVACLRATTAAGLFIMNSTFAFTNPVDANSNLAGELLRHNEVALVPYFDHLLLPQQYTQLIFHNVQSLKNHFSHITNDTIYLHSDILLFVETWSSNSSSLIIPGFSFDRSYFYPQKAIWRYLLCQKYTFKHSFH